MAPRVYYSFITDSTGFNIESFYGFMRLRSYRFFFLVPENRAKRFLPLAPFHRTHKVHSLGRLIKNKKIVITSIFPVTNLRCYSRARELYLLLRAYETEIFKLASLFLR